VTYVRQDWVTWAVFLLPFVEQDNLYKLWDTQLRYYDQPNRGTALDPTPHNVPIYFCPSRRTSTVGFSVATGTTVGLADVPSKPGGGYTHRPGGLSDYATCNGDLDSLNGNGALGIGIPVAAVQPSGTPWTNFAAMYTAPLGTRITQFTSQTNIAAVTDGTSNTLLIGEKYILPTSRWGKGEDRSIYNGAWARIFRRMAGNGALTNPGVLKEDFPLVTSVNDAYVSQTPLREDFQRFGSWHPGVCQFVFCDGSVKAVLNNVNDPTLTALSQRNDGLEVAGNY
jgi:prepilin-type processing-associated H-X9-DG protein